MWIRAGCVLLLLALGCDSLRNRPQPLAKTASLVLHVVSQTPAPGAIEARDPITEKVIYLGMPPIVSAADIATVQRSKNADGSTSLRINMTAAGAQKLSAATSGTAGQQVAFVVNGFVFAVPKVMSPLSTSVEVTGQEISDEMETLLDALTD